MDEELQLRHDRGLLRQRRLRTVHGVQMAQDGHSLIGFASNDYLDLAHDPRLARAAARAAQRFGTGAGAAALVTGYQSPHAALEHALARWECCESAVLFASGYTANVATLASLADRSDAIFSDSLNHASLIDGSRLSRATVAVYQHLDCDHLESLLRTVGASARRRIIATDTVFSMDGDVAPLAELIELAERYDALLVLDEAHGTGVLGPTGGGLVETLPESARGNPDRRLKIGTLSKALGGQGGFAVGPRRSIEFLVNHARGFVFSTAMAPPLAAIGRAAVRIARQATDRRATLQRLHTRLVNGLQTLGYPPPPSRLPTPIVPIILGDPDVAIAASQRLQQLGFLVPAIRPPTVPIGTSRLRISLSAGHSDAQLDALLDALRITLPPR
ncbi:8-amino-7-oxononanoate synthase : 8-amino-7-oxononanoate synthase OS=Sulfobacillus acidophilus (strain TPY) GN=bioF PE=3 SV=1: Aminotran_1_2 [Tuwongella immobilis]|uniref:Aminotransferase class I/classII large domain-containing protein n=2 Tax=Tuwongella immobilis TaxID=692036 RepID=A0A6C2YT49_9BACT|nr:8-amino-7-oxononanoate synthase : 8-amino-7-oxononanoate synthase OS=Sulfobacillus acidophilus (strain TPY) GN=bioF PE=3 SV=1: Aminotran_1_2 [Tuwongella immobilis]VTS06376.1 8-amino-7-oxononanoate synthase : 8-amino-7-oxononanoate synthase OS=Sulfobacillus acidophilus (strain TPY) GN=bioF PE=3 SV=1: Aminotran_1_2 [Tuwongella immobilis]